jgi:acyl carrier protein
MQNEQFLELIEEALGSPKGSVHLEDSLEGLEGWDSMGVLAVISISDEHLGIFMDVDVFEEASTVEDLARAVRCRTAKHKAA